MSGRLIAFRASTARPCPCCGSGSKGCSATDDNLHLCRGDVQPGWKRITRDPDPQGFHHYRTEDDRHANNGKPPLRSASPPPREPDRDWTTLALGYADDLRSDTRAELARQLDLPAESIDAIESVGWNKQEGCWTFPECDGNGNVVGISRRFRDGGKRAVQGGARGLTLAANWRDRPGPVLIVEGPSDVIALTLCGLATIGRPNNMGGAEQIAELVRDLPPDRPLFVVGENDQKPDGKWPGKEGAERVAKILGEKLNRPVPILFPPDGVKDVRAWVCDIATGAAEVVDYPAIGQQILTGLRPAPDGKPRRFTYYDSAVFLTADFRQEFLIPRILVRGQPAVASGPTKSLKTTIVGVDLGISLAAAVPFLGAFPVPRPVRVAIVSGESGKATLQETARRVIRAKGIEPERVFDRLRWCFDLPQFPDLANMTEFAQTLKEFNAEVVVIDPVYLCLGGEVDHANLFEMGAAYKIVADVLLKDSCTLLLVHHATKQLRYGEPMELQHLAYAGLQEFARQFLLLNRQSPYRGDGVHDLWFSAGGSAGHGGLWDLHVEEGTADENFAGRFWNVVVKDADASTADEIDKRNAAKEEAARKKLRADDAKVLDAIDAIVSTGEAGATKNKIQTRRAEMSAAKINQILDRLCEEDVIEEFEFDQKRGKGGTHRTTGFRRFQRSDRLTA